MVTFFGLPIGNLVSNDKRMVEKTKKRKRKKTILDDPNGILVRDKFNVN